MSNYQYPRRLLDDAIDRAVQELVQGDPLPGLRRRVVDKLRAPARRAFWTSRFLIPAGVFASVIVLALWLQPRTQPTPAGPLSTTFVEQKQAAAPTPKVDVVAPDLVSRPPVERRAERHPQSSIEFTFGARNDRVSATNLPSDVTGGSSPDSSAQALPPELPMALPPLLVVPLSGLADITLKPIEIRPISAGTSSVR
jgi:hypothetical protein